MSAQHLDTTVGDASDDAADASSTAAADTDPGDGGDPGGATGDEGEADAAPDDGDGAATDDGDDDDASDDPDTGEPPPSCPGLPGDPGLTTHQLQVGDTMRQYLAYIPASLDPEVGAPIVFVHHGASMSGQAMHMLTGFADLADEEGFVVVFPDGMSALAPWNVGMGVCPPGNLANGSANDLAFFDAMRDEIEQVQCIDADRVYMTGFSMGGYFSNHVGCVRPDVRAVAPHSGGTYDGSCNAGPKPVLLLHGTADGLITLDCGLQARDAWIERNGCSTEFEAVEVVGGSCERHLDCPPDGQVTFCSFEGMSHGWAGAEGSYGGGSQYDDATRIVWDFFQEHP